jgi:hypothetical protein
MGANEAKQKMTHKPSHNVATPQGTERREKESGRTAKLQQAPWQPLWCQEGAKGEPKCSHGTMVARPPIRYPGHPILPRLQIS